jgi:hypothetical protein
MEKQPLQPIVPTAIYDTTLEFCTEQQSRNWHARLRRAGFKRSICKEAYYHPTHWENAAMSFVSPSGKRSAGDYWIMNDAFRCKTKAAREHLKRMEEGEEE